MIASQEDLQIYLYDHVEGLEAANQQQETVEAARLLCKWTGSICHHADLQLGVRWPPFELISQLLEFRGGVRCGGASTIYAAALLACGIPATQYAFGGTLAGWGSFSHATTIFASPRDSQVFYNMDAYLDYHFVDSSGELMALEHMLRLIRARKYSEIHRVDGVVTRSVIRKEGHRDQMQVSMSGFLLTRYAQLHRLMGDMPIDHILLEFMRIFPRIGRWAGPLPQGLYDALLH